MLKEILESAIPRPGEIGGAPYGQLYGSRRWPGYEMLLQRMTQVVQSGDVDRLFDDGDILHGLAPREHE